MPELLPCRSCSSSAVENGVRFVEDRAVRVDPDTRTIITSSGDAFRYDLVAFDVGGINPGRPAGAIATKPLHRIRALERRIQSTLATRSQTLALAVVGGGAAGVELALNITGRFRGAGRAGDLHLVITEQQPRLLPSFPEGMSRYVTELLARRGADVLTGTRVTAVGRRAIMPDEGLALPADVVVWSTGSAGPPLLRTAGLPTDADGFLQVTSTLRSVADPRVFAGGDCASVAGREHLAKIGVHAIKQGATLRTKRARSSQDDRLVGLASMDPRPFHDLSHVSPYA